jgi:hypothetical protein
MAGVKFDRDSLVAAFADLGRKAWELGTTIEIAVYGGSALMLAFDWRVSTRDVDAVFETADRGLVRRLVAEVAEERAWSADWLNDGVKGFLSARDNEGGVKRLMGEFPNTEQPGLRVFVPRPEYLFAMKCRAMRLGGVDGNRDIEDIKQLALAIDIKTADEAIELLLSFYPGNQMQPKVQFGLEEIFSTIFDGSPENDRIIRP